MNSLRNKYILNKIVDEKMKVKIKIKIVTFYTGVFIMLLYMPILRTPCFNIHISIYMYVCQ